eukprot:7150618-Lingulodinium_polyedra.AAC.1
MPPIAPWATLARVGRGSARKNQDRATAPRAVERSQAMGPDGLDACVEQPADARRARCQMAIFGMPSPGAD